MLALLYQPPARRSGIFRQVIQATEEPLALSVKSRLLQDALRQMAQLRNPGLAVLRGLWHMHMMPSARLMAFCCRGTAFLKC